MNHCLTDCYEFIRQTNLLLLMYWQRIMEIKIRPFFMIHFVVLVAKLTWYIIYMTNEYGKTSVRTCTIETLNSCKLKLKTYDVKHWYMFGWWENAPTITTIGPNLFDSLYKKFANYLGTIVANAIILSVIISHCDVPCRGGREIFPGR